MERKRYSFEEKKKIVVDYIKKNPKATYKDIRKDTKIHPERIFNGLKEAFKLAKIKSPRTFDFKNKEEKRKIIIKYIKEHPKVGGHTIAKNIKINVASVFKNIKEAYKLAGIKYPREINSREREDKKREILNLVKTNPLITIKEISKKTKTQPYHFFKNIQEIYKEAKINPIKREEKWRLKKQKEIINFIRKNPLTTQREINKNCNTHVQELFEKGIFGAYKKAKIKFPFERLKLYGVGIKKIRNRAKSFEDEIAIKLSGYGKVNKFVKTKRGVADIILERNDKKIIIEVKDYKNKEISISQIKQLNKYLEDCHCNLGILICHKKPKKDKFLIGKNKIFVLEKGELSGIPSLFGDNR